MRVDKMRIGSFLRVDEMGVDQMGVDQVYFFSYDEMGIGQ